MIAVLGAAGSTGRYLVAALCDSGYAVTAVGRSANRLEYLDTRARRALADLDHPKTLIAALDGASHIVSCVHPRFTSTVLARLPASCERLVLMGSTRRFTALADPIADAVRASEATFLASGVPGVMLHSSMIYGAPDDRNINRLLRLIRRTPVVPLPDGGRHWVQPVFVDDVVAALVAAVSEADAPGSSIVVAGPQPITYTDMVRSCARAQNRRVFIAPVPLPLLAGGVRLASGLGLNLPFDADEIRRTTEDKSFDVSDMRNRLGVTPRSFEDGLELKMARGWV